MKNMKIACWLVLGSLLLTANAAEKTMTLLPTAGAWVVTNNTWVAEIGGLEEGDVLVFDMSRLTAGSGYSVNLGDVTTPRLAGMKFINNNVGLNMQNIAFNFQDGADIYISQARVVIATSSINSGETTPARISRSGTGYMQLESTTNGALFWTFAGGITMVKSDAALGTAPASFTPDAIIMSGGCLATDQFSNDGDLVLSANRGITLANGATAEFAIRKEGISLYLSKITGNGNVLIDGGWLTNAVYLTTACDYTGTTTVGGSGAQNGSDVTLSFTADNVLPSTTTLLGGGARNALVDLNGTAQRVAAVNDTGASTEPLALCGGTLSFGTAGGTTSVRNVTVGSDAVLRLAAGTLALTDDVPPLTLADGTALAAAADVNAYAGDLVLEGNATLSAAGDFALGGTVTGAGTLAATVAGTFTYGLDDGTVRTVAADTFAALSPAPSVLDGLIYASTDVSGYAKGAAFVLFGPTANALTTVDGTVIGYTGAGLDDEASVTVVNGGSVTIHTDTDMTVNRTFTLDATSGLALSGTGRITMSGTVTGGTVTAADGVEVCVPTGETLTLASAVNGALTKTGGGTLTFTGTTAGSCALVVREGVIRLGASAATVGNVTVEEGATLALDADEQIADNSVMTLHGTFDLNGHSETIASFGNRPAGGNIYRTDTSAQIVNSSAADSSLKTTAQCLFYGRATETAGRISLSLESNASSRSLLGGAPGSFAISSISAPHDGMMTYNQHTSFKFRFLRTRSGATLHLSEIQLTCGGVPIPQDAYSTGSSASSTGAGAVMKLFDGLAGTGWHPTDSDTDVTVTVRLTRHLPVDGYRLCGQDLANEPLDWDVYAYRSDYLGTILMDSRRDTHLRVSDDSWTGHGYNLSTNFLFSADCRLAEPFGEQTDFTLAQNKESLVLVGSGPMKTGAVTGPGRVQLQCGTAWAPGDLSGWTGSLNPYYATNAASMVSVLLDATRGPAAQRVPLANPTSNANVTFGNAGETPVALLADDATTATLRGRLADVNGPMGLVKRGSGTVTTEMQDAANTGVTSVEAGRLRVVGPRRSGLTVTAHYLRISPTQVKGGKNWYDTNGYNWGMNEFELLDANGNKVAWPTDKQLTADNNGAGANTFPRLVDGDITSRCLVWNVGQSKTSAILPSVTISSVTGFTFSGYRWYTPRANPADMNRTPVALSLAISDDGTNWTTVDTRSVPWVADSFSTAANPGLLRGPFNLCGESSGIDALYTLPSEYFAAATARDSSAPALVARYFRFEPFSTRQPNVNNVAYGWNISEFGLFRAGERVEWPAETSNRVTIVGGEVSYANNSRPGNVANNVTNDVSNGSDVRTLERCFVTRFPSYAQIDAGEDLTFDSYGFCAAASGGWDYRMPNGWRVWASRNGTDWQILDARIVSDSELKLAQYALQGPWNVAKKYPLLNANNGASNALGDESPVAIASGATLEIAADYEKFGTLSGAGTLELQLGATAEINTLSGGAQLIVPETPAAFSGTVSGSGTLVVSGVATQTFANASLAGVTTLEVNGGVVDGTASAPGALAVAFGGGTWFGELTADGALTVTGTPVIGLPADPGAAFRKTLFTYTSIDATSAAALAAATFDQSVTLPKGLKPRVNVGATSCVLTIAADGTIMLFR